MIARLHAYLVMIWVAFSTAACVLGLIPVVLIRRSGDATSWAARWVWGLTILRLAGIRVAIRGRENLPPGPAIYASNHESAFDIPLLFQALPQNSLRFVAKRELFDIPVFGWYLALAGYVKVDRSNRAQAVASLKAAGEQVRAGISLITFPEGTRSDDGRIHPFKKGPFALAVEADVPVVPIAIAGARDVTPKGQLVIHPGEARIAIGVPVYPRELGHDRTALLREVRRRIIELHLSLGGLGGDPANAIAAAGQEGIGEDAARGPARNPPSSRAPRGAPETQAEERPEAT